jgi:hypothetical protein
MSKKAAVRDRRGQGDVLLETASDRDMGFSKDMVDELNACQQASATWKTGPQPTAVAECRVGQA